MRKAPDPLVEGLPCGRPRLLRSGNAVLQVISMAEWTRVAAEVDVPVGTLRSAMAGSQPLVLANVDGDICALEDQCSHQEFPLSDGELDGSDVICIHHGARFDACTGRNKALPAIRPVKSFSVDVRDGEIYVEV